MRDRLIPLIAAGALALAAGPAAASVLVLGDSMAAACSQAAFAGRSDPESIALCARALDEPLNRRDQAGTHVNHGIMLMRRRDYAAARLDFERAIVLEPGLGEGYVNRGVARMAEPDYPAALADIERGLELGVDEPAKAYYNRGLVHESLGDAHAAWLDYRKAQALDPDWDAPRRQLKRFTVRQP